MDDLASRPSEDGRHGHSTANAPPPGRWIRGGYLVIWLALIAAYPFLPTAGRNTVLLLASLGVIPAVLVGLRRISPGQRRSWVLLLVAFAVINVANVITLFAGNPAVTAGSPLDAAGNLLVLVAAMVLVMQARNNIGSITDTTIAAVALSAVLWNVVLAPNLVPEYQTGSAKLALSVALVALSGVLGALAQLAIQRPVAALWPLIAALALAIVGNVVVVVTTDPPLNTAAGMMFVGAYTAVALFGLDPTASQLVTPAPIRPDTLSLGRLVFLGLAIAIVPTVVGVSQLESGSNDGLVLVISSTTVATLVMLRIGQLSAQRDHAERALQHEATHDALTGLPNRKEFVTQLGEALGRDQPCAILFCDLDHFKTVNDRYGHASGDLLLIEVSKRLRNSVRADDLVSRFGGDEFVILIRDKTPHEVQSINQRINDALSRPVPLPVELVTIGASIGIALATDDLDPEELITRADHAMYAAKYNGRP